METEELAGEGDLDHAGPHLGDRDVRRRADERAGRVEAELVARRDRLLELAQFGIEGENLFVRDGVDAEGAVVLQGECKRKRWHD